MSLPKTYSVNHVAALNLNLMTVFFIKNAILETDSNLQFDELHACQDDAYSNLQPRNFCIPLHHTLSHILEGKLYMEWISTVEQTQEFPAEFNETVRCPRRDTKLLRFDSDEFASRLEKW